ncbi:DUF6786 family protein [Flavivirga algicola]|uniref:Lipoprotein n=1 Tax=Flavivirga algicola TaxID=2729136 RepID=A0ABX1RVG8_9FLAO|nr:DUF6786 family protein [Flavivirga algicola]NMH86773.1 hypothetical protein [Flavivirga algicola]
MTFKHHLITKIILSTLIVTSLLNCKKPEAKISNNPSFADHVKKLEVINGLQVLKHDNAAIAFSGAYQGRVFTSTANGLNGKPYGHVNWKLLDEGTYEHTMARLGGESRMWFGPEFGKYSIFFDKDAKQDIKNIKISPDLDIKKFSLIEKDKLSATYGADLEIRNTFGYIFNINAKRKISLLTQPQIENDLNIILNENISFVGFSAETTIKNLGEQWRKENGLLSIWELGCMLTNPDNRVIIPLKKETDSVTGYFTPVTSDRLVTKDSVVFYKADADGLNKIGVRPDLSKNIMGSYSAKNNLLNIVKFTFENDSLYVNSLPGNDTPYNGDVTNIFNGEVDEALDKNWPFYEFESSSSTKELNTNETMHHKHTTYHFEGSFEDLNAISLKVLGVDLSDIPKF